MPNYESAQADGRCRTRALVAAGATDGDTVVDTLGRLCSAAVKELRMSGAVVNVLVSAGANAVVASSDAASRRLGELHMEFGEGPGQDAFDHGQPTLVPDLGAVSQWLGYGPAACAVGAGAVFVFPLRIGAARFGLLTLFCGKRRVLSDDELERCLAFADLATELLLHGLRATANGHLDPDLLNALEFRTQVYQAQGMVAIDLDSTLDTALVRMRAYAFSTGIDLGTLSADIVARRTRLSNDDRGTR